MKNKKLLKAIAALTMSVAAASTMSLFGCKHSHDFSGDWKTDAEYHWKECEKDGEKDQLEKHVFTDENDPTCNTCGYERTITPPSHTHEYGEWKSDDDKHWKECTANDGSKSEEGTHTWVDSTTEMGKEVCSVCGKVRDKVNENPNPTDPVALEDIKVDVDMLAEAAFSVDAPTNWDADGVIKLYSRAGVDADGNPKNTVWSYEGASGTAVKDAAGETYKTTVGRLKPNGSAPYIIIDLKGYTGNGKITLSCVPAGGSERSITFAENVDGAEAIFTQSYTDSKTKLYITQDIVGGKEYKISFSNGFNFFGIIIEKDAGSTNPPDIPDVPDTSLDDAKTAAKAELDGYKSSIIAEIDDEAIKTQIAEKKTAGNAAIDAATTTDAVATALTTAKAEVDALVASVTTLAQLQANAVTTLSNYADTKKAGYDATNDAALIEAIEAVVSKYATETTGLFFAETVTKENLPALEAAAKKEIDDLIAETTMTVYDKLVAQNKTLVILDETLAADTKLSVKENNDKVGIYMLADQESDYSKEYVKVIDENGVKALQQVGQGATGAPNIITDLVLGQNKGKIEGYFEFKLDTLISATSASSQQPIRFLDAAGNVKLLIGEKKNGNLYYKIGSDAEVDITATKLVVNEYSTVYFVFENGKLSVKINDKEVITDAEIGDSLGCVRLISSNKGGRRVTARKIIVVGTAMTVGEKAEAKLAQLTAAYGAYDVENTTVYDDAGKAQLTAAYNAGKAVLEGYITDAEATDELVNKAYSEAIAAMKAVLTIAESELANAKTAAITELNATDKTNYTINAEAVDGAIADGVKAINAATDAEKVTAALNAAKAAIAEIDNDETALPKLKAAAVAALEAYDGGADNFTIEGEGGNKTAYETALTAGTKAINDITVSESLSYVDAVTAINTALENAKAAIDEIDNDAEMLAKAKTVAIAAIDKLVADKKAEIDAKVESGDITDTDKVAEVKTEIDSIRNTRVRAIEVSTSIADVEDNKTQAINNIETQAATLTATPEQLRALAEKAINEHADSLKAKHPEYADKIASICNDALKVLEGKTDKEEISTLQTTTTREMTVYVAEQEAYKEIDKYAAELKDSIYNDAAKAAIDAEIKRGIETDSKTWSADMWAIHIAIEEANVTDKKKIVIAALDKIVADLKATKFTVTINVEGIENVEVLYGGTVVIDDSTLADDKMIDDGKWYTNADCTEEFDFTTKIYDNGVSLYAKLADAVVLDYGCTWSYAANGATLPEKIKGTGLTENSSKSCMELAPSADPIEVEMKGSGTGNYIKVTVKSTSGSNWSTIGVKDEDGNYIEILEALTANIAKDANKNLYAVKSETVSTLTFKTYKAGTYTIFAESTTADSNLGAISRSVRITAIKINDILKAKKDVFVTWGEGATESYYHSQEITVPEYTGTGAFQYWYVEGKEDGTHYLVGEKVTLPAGTYTMVAKTVSANVTITYKIDGEEDKVVSYYVADGDTGITNTVSDPVKGGYSFVGWFESATPAEGANPFDFSTVSANDTITLHAVFEVVATISDIIVIDGNTGTAVDSLVSTKNLAKITAEAAAAIKEVATTASDDNTKTFTHSYMISSGGKGLNITAGDKAIIVKVYVAIGDSKAAFKAETLSWADSTGAHSFTTSTAKTAHLVTVKLNAGASTSSSINCTSSTSRRLYIMGIEIETTTETFAEEATSLVEPATASYSINVDTDEVDVSKFNI